MMSMNPSDFAILKTKNANNHYIKDIINPYNCLLKKADFSIKTSNKQITSYINK